MRELSSENFRNQLLDVDANGYCFNWFCMDHVGYKNNPRRRTMGYHGIFEEYKRMLKEYDCQLDRLYWHFHPIGFSRDARLIGHNFSFTNSHYEILTRKIIDHGWFPAAIRPTLSIRMDGNLWLEQWIPFDLGNMNVDDHSDLKINSPTSKSLKLYL